MQQKILGFPFPPPLEEEDTQETQAAAISKNMLTQI